MKRLMFLVDGFNLYHSLQKAPHFIKNKKKYQKYKWLDIRKLCELYIEKDEKIVAIKYFTAFAFWRPDSCRRHEQYIKALASVGVVTIFGKFYRKYRVCSKCNQYYESHEEKRTDVNIAISLLVNAVQDKYDTAIIISADSDLIPAIEAVKLNFPNKNIGIIIPLFGKAKELKKIADFHSKINEGHLRSCQFSDTIDIGSGVKLTKPPEWV
jgi:uncharacterized LabA/DUF88 family protein